MPHGHSDHQAGYNEIPGSIGAPAAAIETEDSHLPPSPGRLLNDGDTDTLTYSLTGNDAGSFNIGLNSGQLQVKDTLDYEKRKRYTLTVTVTVTDGKADDGSADGALDDAIDVTISVGNLDEAGAVSFDADPPRAGSTLTAVLKDPDGSLSGATWTWERSTDGNEWPT